MNSSDSEKRARQLLQQADALAAQGRWSESVHLLEQTLERWPFLADSWYNLGLRRRRIGLPIEALEAYQRALDHAASSPEEIHLNRGVILAEDLLRHAEAEREYRQALQLAPGYPPALLNLANLCEDDGRRQEARALYAEILAGDPHHHEALARFVNCSEIDDPRDPLIVRLQEALQLSALPAAAAASLGFALGRALDATRQYTEAWRVYAAANAASRASAPRGVARYDRVAHEALITQIIEVCSESFLERLTDASPAAGTDNRGLVMICGMFRSGSTLVEHLLAGHPRVMAGGELDWLPALVRDELSPFPTSIRSLDASRVAAFGARYLAKRSAVFPQADVLSDKRPDNFLYLGLARAMLPRTRFVHTRRHPLDNCLSVWFLHLDHGMSYATDLLDIGHYYLQQERLMSHWRRVLGDSVGSVDYDALVHQPRTQMQSLLEHCGLDWDDRCLDPRNSESRVGTASVWQVRQPLYQRSSGRWHHYAQQLAPLRAMLEASGVDLGA